MLFKKGPDRGRDLISLAINNPASSWLLRRFANANDRRPNLLRVLMYHRIDTYDARPALNPGLISTTPSAFEEQMRLLATDYRVLSTPEILAAMRAGIALPPRAVLLTFDDAYGDFAENAWPILHRYRLPATLFVPTAYPGRRDMSFWWDRLHQAVCGASRRDPWPTPLGNLPLATQEQRRQTLQQLSRHVKALPHAKAMAFVDKVCDELEGPSSENHVADWPTLRRLARDGVTLASHTRTHPLLDRISAVETRAEVRQSLEDLEREVGPVPRVFAYPDGRFNRESLRVLREEGFDLAFTTAHGINDMKTADRMRLRRIGVGRRTTPAVLRACLHPWSVCFNRG